MADGSPTAGYTGCVALSGSLGGLSWKRCADADGKAVVLGSKQLYNNLGAWGAQQVWGRCVYRTTGATCSSAQCADQVCSRANDATLGTCGTVPKNTVSSMLIPYLHGGGVHGRNGKEGGKGPGRERETRAGLHKGCRDACPTATGPNPGCLRCSLFVFACYTIVLTRPVAIVRIAQGSLCNTNVNSPYGGVFTGSNIGGCVDGKCLSGPCKSDTAWAMPSECRTHACTKQQLAQKVKTCCVGNGNPGGLTAAAVLCVEASRGLSRS